MHWSELDSTQKRGDVGMSMAIAYFTRHGYTVSIPLTDSQDYDLIADLGGALVRVQVKTTTYKRPNGVSEVSLKTMTGTTKKRIHKTFDQVSCDYLFVVTTEDRMFMIPKDEVAGKTTLAIENKYAAYEVEL